VYYELVLQYYSTAEGEKVKQGKTKQATDLKTPINIYGTYPKDKQPSPKLMFFDISATTP